MQGHDDARIQQFGCHTEIPEADRHMHKRKPELLPVSCPIATLQSTAEATWSAALVQQPAAQQREQSTAWGRAEQPQAGKALRAEAAKQPGDEEWRQQLQASNLEAWSERLRVPWGPLLTSSEAARGMAYYGSGDRLRRVAAKLLAGKPIKVRSASAALMPCLFVA